jgi:RNA polymerase sigma factor (sigma-70 family)
MRHARHWTRSEAAAEDLCAESFTRVLYAIRNGNGPTEAFRPYLLTAMRNVARDWAEGDRRTLLVPDLVDVAPVEPEADPVIEALERSLAGLAFMSLPERWQTVLWQTEVEEEGPTQLAPQLGIDAAAVAALAYRAREGLKQAYLQAHITEIGSPSCRPYAERLGTHTRGKLRGREAAKVRHHLKHCAECVGLYTMLKYVNGNIHVIIGPAVLGAAAATRAGIVLVGTGSGAAGAGGGGAAAHHGVVLRSLSKARHASPRQQAVAAGTTVAVAAAAIAFALTGNESAPPPVAAARPSPSKLAPSSPPAPTPKPTPTPPAPSPQPSSPAPVVVQSTPPPKPSPKPSTPKPSPTPTPKKPSPSPTPTPTPTKVLCPGSVTDLDLLGGTVQVGLGLEPGLGLEVRIGGIEVDVVIGAGCPTGGPPRPFPLPSRSATASTDAETGTGTAGTGTGTGSTGTAAGSDAATGATPSAAATSPAAVAESAE